MKKLVVLLAFIFPILSGYSQITVVTPNGGENWEIGCPGTISWTCAATTSMKIELYSNGNLFMNIAQQVPPNQYSYSWTPTYAVVAGSTYKIKITSLNNTGTFDFSDANFTLSYGSVTVTSPNGGEVWQYGTTHLITWTDNICEDVKIELWKGGAFNSLLTSSTPSNGSFAWAITSNYTAGSDYKIKIMSVNSASGTNGVVFDFSDNNFTIGSNNTAQVTVIAPNGGESWIIGCPNTISWLTSAPGPVKIELFKNDL
ncbi:MAG: Ser-Thr-rich GPI-anchored membrane family protein [Bacteroidota bacterium]